MSRQLPRQPGRVHIQRPAMRAVVAAHPNVLYVFDDDLAGTGLAGMAAEMRCEPNAVGIPVQRRPGMAAADFFTDEDYPTVQPAISAALRQLYDHVVAGGDVILPANGLSCGRSPLGPRAPRIQRLIDTGLIRLRTKAASAVLAAAAGGQALAYAGLGASNAPGIVCDTANQIGQLLAEAGWQLRSGAASPMEAAFGTGCVAGHGHSQIFLPWRDYQEHASALCTPAPHAYTLASELHPDWSSVDALARSKHAVAAHQILGAEVMAPAAVCLCWTPEGRASGELATAIRICECQAVPVLNLGRWDLDRLNCESAAARILEWFYCAIHTKTDQ